MLVGNFEKKVAEMYGIGVQVANPADTTLADNGITISNAGKLTASTEDKLKKYEKVFKDGNIYTVQLGGRWGFLDKNGDELIAPKYNWLGEEFIEGMIVVGGEEGIGYVNDKGIEVIKPVYKTAKDSITAKLKSAIAKSAFISTKKENESNKNP